MALMDFSIDTSGSPQDVQRKQALADALMKQGMDSSAAAGGKGGGWITALNRGLAGALGGYQQGQARQEEQQGRDSVRQQLAAALQGNGGKIDPQTMIGLASNPWATPGQTSVVTHVADMQNQQARQAVEDQHWKASYQLQKEAAARAADKTPAGFMADPAVPGGYKPIPGGPADPSYLSNAMAAKGTDLPNSAKEYQFYLKTFQPTPDAPQPMDYGTFSTAKARAAATNVTTNVDTKGPDKYDTVMGEGLAKSHSALSNGVEDAQARARDLAAMQGAVDAIQKNGGTTGGMGQAQALEVAKTINAGAAALGLGQPIDEKGISDKEFLTKFNRQIAGAQAKGAMGSRVTNFEMANYLKANPGLEMSITGNQRLIGIQAQIEQRNVAVGNAIRAASAEAVGAGQRVNPAKIEKIIREYDETHHIKDPVTGQDLTQSYTLPEFQSRPGSSNQALSNDNKANMKKLGAKTYEKIDGVWHEVQ
ncbi:hypothetical protein AAFG22_14845 [Bradyrhizobium sp. B024]|uniref:hypothetical protein n=1 Tax=Bradyrhizobium sp. B024 TaxID=3140247 RepID=UPI0031835060